MRKEDIYWHFRTNKYSYKIVLVGILSVGLYVAVIVGVGERKIAKREEVKNWPTVDAMIFESKVTFLDTSGNSSFNGSHHVKLRVAFLDEVTGRRLETRVYGRWNYRADIGGVNQFEVGKTIRLRVNPEKPKQASLIDITGTI